MKRYLGDIIDELFMSLVSSFIDNTNNILWVINTLQVYSYNKAPDTCAFMYL